MSFQVVFTSQAHSFIPSVLLNFQCMLSRPRTGRISCIVSRLFMILLIASNLSELFTEQAKKVKDEFL